jgi:sialate O-acetylesterase
MKTKILGVLVAGLLTLAGIPQAGAEEKLIRGKDRIDVPAIGDGLCLHNLFQSGMVIQRDKPIRIRGWAEPGENVSVTFGEKTQSSTAAADRSWKVELPALPASSEPHQLIVQGKAATLKLEDILIGDVWLLGGQSNMEFPIHKLDGGSLEIASANFKNIRLFTVPQLNGPDSKTPFHVCINGMIFSRLTTGRDIGMSARRRRSKRCPASATSLPDAFTWRRKFPSESLIRHVAAPASRRGCRWTC